MHRKYQRQVRGDIPQRRGEQSKYARIIHAGVGAVSRSIAAAPVPKSCTCHRLTVRAATVGIDQILPTRSIRSSDALPPEILVGIRRRRPQQVGEHVGHQPVKFLRHRAVEARALLRGALCVSSCAYERDRCRRPRRRPRPWRAARRAARAQHHAGGLVGMAAASDAEMIRRRQAEITKESIRHVGVVMLAGMDQPQSKADGLEGKAARLS